MADTYRSGSAAITVEQTAMLRLLDRVSDGAGTQFVERARAELGAIMASAVDQWPVRTGLSKSSFRLRVEITESELRVAIGNPARASTWPVHKIRWSVRTKESLDAEVRSRAAQSQNSTKSEAYWRRELRRRHGEGAPTAALAGRQPWAVLVRTPARKAAKPMIEALRAQLAALAKGG